MRRSRFRPALAAPTILLLLLLAERVQPWTPIDPQYLP